MYSALAVAQTASIEHTAISGMVKGNISNGAAWLGDFHGHAISEAYAICWVLFMEKFHGHVNLPMWRVCGWVEWKILSDRYVDCLHNNPSVMVWIPFNEAWGQHDTLEIAAWLKSYDPSRLLGCVEGDSFYFWPMVNHHKIAHHLGNMFTTKPSKVGKYRKWWKLFWSWRYCWSSQLSRSWFSTWRCTIWELHQGDWWIWWSWFGTSGGAFVANITEELGLWCFEGAANAVEKFDV